MKINSEVFLPKQRIFTKNNKESQGTPDYLKTSPHKMTKNNFDTLTFPSRLPKKTNHSFTRTHAFNLGNSYEAPTYFISKNSIFDERSYNNPYLENREKWPVFSKINNELNNMNEFQINNSIDQRVKTSGRSKTFFNIVSNHSKEREILNLPNENAKPTLYQNKYKFLSDSSPLSFHKKKGLFSDFVERNNNMNVYGPLINNERNYKRKNGKYPAINTENNDASSSKNKTTFDYKTNTKTRNTSLKTVSWINPFEINEEKYLSHDQKYLNVFNNNILKMKMKNMLELKINKQTFFYNNLSRIKKDLSKYKINPIDDFEEKMLKTQNLYRKHIKALKKEKKNQKS